MKIELDLDKVRADVSLRKEAMDSANSITMQVRRWAEMVESSAKIPDEVLVEMMQGQIKNRISEFMQYAPDVSDIKPQEVNIQTDLFRGVKQVVGSFYYCSQIVDHWKEQEARAVEAARQSAKTDAYYLLRDIFAEDCEYGAKECWQKDAMEYMDKMLGEDNE